MTGGPHLNYSINQGTTTTKVTHQSCGCSTQHGSLVHALARLFSPLGVNWLVGCVIHMLGRRIRRGQVKRCRWRRNQPLKGFTRSDGRRYHQGVDGAECKRRRRGNYNTISHFGLGSNWMGLGLWLWFGTELLLLLLGICLFSAAQTLTSTPLLSQFSFLSRRRATKDRSKGTATKCFSSKVGAIKLSLWLPLGYVFGGFYYKLKDIIITTQRSRRSNEWRKRKSGMRRLKKNWKGEEV